MKYELPQIATMKVEETVAVSQSILVFSGTLVESITQCDFSFEPLSTKMQAVFLVNENDSSKGTLTLILDTYNPPFELSIPILIQEDGSFTGSGEFTAPFSEPPVPICLATTEVLSMTGKITGSQMHFEEELESHDFVDNRNETCDLKAFNTCSEHAEFDGTLSN